MGVRIDIKGKMNRNESYREKNKGPAYVPRFVTTAQQYNYHVIIINESCGVIMT